MLIFLAFGWSFLHFLIDFCFHAKNLFDDLPKSLKHSSGTWLHICPDSGEGYRLFDPLEGREMGRILFDKTDHWVYDSVLLNVAEQKEAAGAITGYQNEMDALFHSLKR